MIEEMRLNEQKSQRPAAAEKIGRGNIAGGARDKTR